MYRFQTGFFPFSHELDPKEIIQGKGWTVSFEEVETSLPWSSKDSYQAVLHARTLETASNAFNLIGAAITLRNDGFLTETPYFPLPEDERLLEKIIQKYGHEAYTHSTCGIGFIPDGVRIAARASNSMDYQYALLKYRMGCFTHSLPSVEIDPSYATEHLGKVAFRDVHIILASSIVTFYSVIEQLELEVRASASCPSRMNGKWNPPVFIDITRRLRLAGIDVEQPSVWVQRGKSTTVGSVALKNVQATKAPWSRGLYVRDKFIDVRDAILAASNLRSKVSSHRLDPKKVSALTAYDAENVRILARRLLLTSLGCRIFEVAE
ncbi:conserved protein of unknown function [Desulfovibrio sp. 86]|nr:conserved protein of unknown function [Desulfovibrio sp. 86]